MIVFSFVTSNHHFLYTVFAAEEYFHKYTTINPTGRLNVGNVDMDLLKFKGSLSGNFKFDLQFCVLTMLCLLGLSIKTSWLGLKKIIFWLEKKHDFDATYTAANGFNIFSRNPVLFQLIWLENAST